MSLEVLLVPAPLGDTPQSMAAGTATILSGTVVLPDEGKVDALASCISAHVPFSDDAVLTPSFVGIARRVGGAVIVEVDWACVSAVGPQLAHCADHHGFWLYAPDAASLGEDPQAPRWDRLQKRALGEIRRAWNDRQNSEPA